VLGPIVLRNIRTQFRLHRLRSVLLALIYPLALITLFLLNYSFIGSLYNSWEESLKYYWFQILGIQYFVLFFGGTLKVAASIVRERQEKRFDFELMTGISPASIARQLLLGTPVFVYFLIGITLPFSLLCLFGGGVDKDSFLACYLVLISCGLFFHAWALFASASARRFAGSAIVSVLFVLLFLCAALLVQADIPEFRFLAKLSPLYLPYAHLRGIPVQSIQFLDFTIDLPVCLAIFYIFFGFWFTVAAARRIERQENTCLSRTGAAFFIATFNFLLAGFLVGKTLSFTPVEQKSENFLFHSFLYISANFLLLLLFVFLLTPSGKRYIAGAREKRTGSGLYPIFFSEGSLLFANYFLLFGISAALYYSVFVPWSMHPPLSDVVGGRPILAEVSAALFFVLVCGFFWASLVQVFLFLSSRAGKELAAILLLALVAIPTVADLTWGRSGSGWEQIFNPVTVLLSILPTEVSTRGSQFPLPALLFYLFAGIALAAFVLARARAMRVRPPSYGI